MNIPERAYSISTQQVIHLASLWTVEYAQIIIDGVPVFHVLELCGRPSYESDL